MYLLYIVATGPHVSVIHGGYRATCICIHNGYKVTCICYTEWLQGHMYLLYIVATGSHVSVSYSNQRSHVFVG